ncbi:hypothetical protein SteCoe_16218 [Stentor coeruleus]|uniref:Uncharacterized protein n=1 Tax=Stentor coeruleus TaxID=5963 RepID=A0A1R2C1X9_9CILI|nr:hypothetical protein SteCoe_16218 [Stentor coeruleus]
MLPKITRRKSSLGTQESSPTSIFGPQLQFQVRHRGKKYSEIPKIFSNFDTEALEIKRLHSRIAKLKKDNNLLKEFILSNNLSQFSQKESYHPSPLSSYVDDEFAKLEEYLISKF